MSVRDPTDKKPFLVVTRRHRPVFRIVLAHRVCVALLSCSHEFGWFHTGFSRNLRFSGFWRGLGDFVAARGPKRYKSAQKWIFLVLGAVLGETPANQLDHMLYADPVNPVWGLM